MQRKVDKYRRNQDILQNARIEMRWFYGANKLFAQDPTEHMT